MNVENDVMLSYNWETKYQICKLEDELKKKGLKVWRDDTQLCSNDKPLTEQLGNYFIQDSFSLKLN